MRHHLILVSAVALTLSACEKPRQYGDRICADATGHRSADWNCQQRYAGGHPNGFLWYYLGTLHGRTAQAPLVGGPVYGGSYRAAPGVTYGAPGFAASSISRGGFGSSAHAGGVGE